MSVQFDAPKGLNQAHLGAFWASQRGEFAQVKAIQPIATTHEVFGEHGQWLPPSLQLALTNEPDSRLQMTTADDQWMCQLQRNRLVINWRKRTEQYPRFSATRDRFMDAWEGWNAFLHDFELGRPKVRMWELTYVNRVPKDNLWEAANDWPNIFPGLWGGAFVDLNGVNLRGLHGQWVWESSDPPARLYVEPKPARSTDESQSDVLLLTLTARGLVCQSREDTNQHDPFTVGPILKGIELGHELIVTAFDRITSDAAKKRWGRHDHTD